MMAILVIAEHDNAEPQGAQPSSTVTAATQMGGDVACAGGRRRCRRCRRATAAGLAGVTKVLHCDDAMLTRTAGGTLAALVVGLMADHDTMVAPATTTGKNVMPRVSPRCST